MFIEVVLLAPRLNDVGRTDEVVRHDAGNLGSRSSLTNRRVKVCTCQWPTSCPSVKPLRSTATLNGNTTLSLATARV